VRWEGRDSRASALHIPRPPLNLREHDIVMPKDNVPIVNHDIFMGYVANIVAQFP
jgi:hypothetical protein